MRSLRVLELIAPLRLRKRETKTMKTTGRRNESISSIGGGNQQFHAEAGIINYWGSSRTARSKNPTRLGH